MFYCVASQMGDSLDEISSKHFIFWNESAELRENPVKRQPVSVQLGGERQNMTTLCEFCRLLEMFRFCRHPVKRQPDGATGRCMEF